MNVPHRPHLCRNALTEVALKALHLTDLTSLNLDDTPSRIEALVASADTPVGTPAAICIYPRFLLTARAALRARGLSLPIATVTNFPAGTASPEQAAQETAAAVASGADEVDVVFPYRALLEGDPRIGQELVAQNRDAAGKACLKVIIESGELVSPKLIRQASEIAIEAGADFIKTSTGKVAVNATLEAAEVILISIRESKRPVGFKAAGGVRCVAEAAPYLALAERLFGPGWATADTFRFGGSSLLGDLLATLGHAQSTAKGFSW